MDAKRIKMTGIGLAVAGGAFLSAALVLVFRVGGAECGTAAPSQRTGSTLSTAAAPPQSSSAPDTGGRVVRQVPDTERNAETQAAPQAGTDSADKGAAPAPLQPSSGPWTIRVSDRYELDAQAKAQAAQVAAALQADTSSSVRLVGVNDMRKSSKRALRAAQVVWDEVRRAAGDVKEGRAVIASEQQRDFDGIEVRIELLKGAR